MVIVCRRYGIPCGRYGHALWPIWCVADIVKGQLIWLTPVLPANGRILISPLTNCLTHHKHDWSQCVRWKWRTWKCRTENTVLTMLHNNIILHFYTTTKCIQQSIKITKAEGIHCHFKATVWIIRAQWCSQEFCDRGCVRSFSPPLPSLSIPFLSSLPLPLLSLRSRSLKYS